MKYLLFPILAIVLISGCATGSVTGEVKEFSMNSFYSPESGPQFSVKELSVNRGDTVIIHITNTNGNHNFNIDEFGVGAETPLNTTTTVRFVADKAGSFVYYCSKPGHRAAGHWGTLNVT